MDRFKIDRIDRDFSLEDGLFIGFDKDKYGDNSSLCVIREYSDETIEILKMFKNEEAEYLHDILIGKEKLILKDKGEE